MNEQFLNDNQINNIIDHRGQNVTPMDVEEALSAMLKLTHLFKYEMDCKSAWFQVFDKLEEEADYFYEMTGWEGMEPGKNKINIDYFLQYQVNLQNLFLQSIYALNGSNYQSNVQSNGLEDLFDRIFENVPKGKEFDFEIIRLLLLPIYNSIHKTNYKVKEVIYATS